MGHLALHGNRDAVSEITYGASPNYSVKNNMIATFRRGGGGVEATSDLTILSQQNVITNDIVWHRFSREGMYIQDLPLTFPTTQNERFLE